MQKQSKTVLNKYFAQFDKRAEGDGLFFTERNIIMDYGLWYLGQKHGLNV